MKNIKFKRITAYLIDFLIVTVIISLLTQIRFLNPNIEEQNKAIEKYNEIYEEYYESVSSVDENMTVSEIKTTLDAKKVVNNYYDVVKYSYSNIIISIVVIILYYSLFPYFFDGQTIGKKLINVCCVTDNDKKVPFYKYLIRSLILPIYSGTIFNTAFTQLIFILLTFIFKSKFFADYYLIITLINMAWGYVDIIVFLIRKDGKTLHDVILKTNIDFKNK